MEGYIGEIRMVAFDFAPEGWQLCNGQLLNIAQHQALFSLLGTKYGGDGRQTFGLPDLRGRVPLGTSATYPIGQKGGSEQVELTSDQIPVHTHPVTVSFTSKASKDSATTGDPTNAVLANTGFTKIYNTGTPDTELKSEWLQGSGVASSNTSGNTSHNNMQPFLTVNFIIAVNGLYPRRP